MWNTFDDNVVTDLYSIFCLAIWFTAAQLTGAFAALFFVKL